MAVVVTYALVLLLFSWKRYCLNIKKRASDISEKFIDAFKLFANCHKIYDSNEFLLDEDITQLGIYIMQ